MSKRFSIVTITGPDGVGKTSQARLMSEALQPSQQLAFPDNNHWSGRIIRAILAGAPFAIGHIRYGAQTEYTIHQEPKEAISFQYLQAISRLYWKERIEAGLREHHWIMARYDSDAIAYGCAEGTPLDLTLMMLDQDIPSDLIVILDGKGFRSPGEELDLNDRNKTLQRRVREIYQAQALLWPDKVVTVNVDKYSTHEVRARNLAAVHRHLCQEIGKRIGEKITPVSYERILELLPELKDEQLVLPETG